MAELKTKQNNASVSKFLSNVEDEQKKKDSKALLKIFEEASKLKPKMWGDSIVGFGSYYYESTRSSQKGEWFLIGFSPRKNYIAVYIIPGVKSYPDLFKKLGKHKVSSGSCVYIKKLEDIDTKILTKIIKKSLKDADKLFYKK